MCPDGHGCDAHRLQAERQQVIIGMPRPEAGLAVEMLSGRVLSRDFQVKRPEALPFTQFDRKIQRPSPESQIPRIWFNIELI